MKIDWSQSNAEIARQTGKLPQSVGTLRIRETGQNVHGKRFDPPPGVILGETILQTADYNGVPEHVAAWWHKVLKVPHKKAKGATPSTMPADFAPVLEISVAATARKYGVSEPTARKWISRQT